MTMPSSQKTFRKLSFPGGILKKPCHGLFHPGRTDIRFLLCPIFNDHEPLKMITPPGRRQDIEKQTFSNSLPDLHE